LGNSAGTYDLTASFRSANGVAIGTDVRLAGVKVGTISNMALNPQTYFADVVVTLDTSVQLPTDTAILISSEGLLGGNFIELVPGGAVEVLAAGDQIEDTQSSRGAKKV
jgi:phospholipid/cholesterol/gamma-HCH transport system substrate-binding protein